MKMRSKGKVYPSSSSSTPSSSPATSPAGDSLAVLTLLPAAIITLTVVLSAEDREVLAYMITRSIKSTNPSSSSVGNSNNNSNNSNSKRTPATHKPPVFDCDCFDCYTSYWFKWDTSVNRELIHHAIEAFEETLTTNEQLKKKGKRKEKSGHRRLAGKPFAPPCDHHTPPQYDLVSVESKAEECTEEEGEEVGVLNTAVEIPPETTVAAGGAPASHQHKGLTRKVLPDVMGLFNWRLWSLWSPNDV